jgi:hypothetical protein
MTRYKANATKKDVSNYRNNTTKDTASGALGDVITLVFIIS